MMWSNIFSDYYIVPKLKDILSEDDDENHEQQPTP